MEVFFGMTNALPSLIKLMSRTHWIKSPNMILLVCAYICLPLRSAQLSTYHYCVALCKLFQFSFLHLETQPRCTCQKHSSWSFVELENQDAENIHNNTNDDNDMQFWQL